MNEHIMAAVNPDQWTGLVTAIGLIFTTISGIVVAILNFLNNKKAVVARTELKEMATVAADKATEVKEQLAKVTVEHKEDLTKIVAAVNGNSLRERALLTRRIAEMSNLPADIDAANSAKTALENYEQSKVKP